MLPTASCAVVQTRGDVPVTSQLRLAHIEVLVCFKLNNKRRLKFLSLLYRNASNKRPLLLNAALE